ncbi:hypothetical protein LTR56_019909 [Elasticomyces elasticus]|nr:hypothetical protein LTR56_019909 [Elasticomyces elasticus]KAK3643404.1 hypothetical protein LTR22_015707 [Elasticomyces elasticus]KAK5755455.1 hypothetical protein LTS12_014440 [Elasticomyces elasticus]
MTSNEESVRLVKQALALAAQQQQSQNDALDEIKVLLDYERNQRLEKQGARQGYLKWVKVTDLNVESILKNRLARRPKGTGNWIYDDGIISSWMSSGDETPRILWINADPGFGKTFLVAHVVEELQHTHPTGIAYFFCSLNDEPTKRTVQAVLRFWLYQLVREVDVDGEDVVTSLVAGQWCAILHILPAECGGVSKT